MPAPEADLTLLLDAARDAGDIAMRHFGANPEIWEKDGGAGPVTEADLAVDRYLRDRLCAARPGYGWLSEETQDSADRLGCEQVFVIDPIDGTRAFIDGQTAWALSLAVVTGGEVSDAVVYLPAKNRLYSASKGQGARVDGSPATIAPGRDIAGARVLTARPTLEARHWRGGTPPPVERKFRSSLAYRLSLVAEGRYDAMMTLRPTWEWDVAAGALIVSEAGGAVTDRGGAPLLFNNPHPQVAGVVAGSAEVQAALTARLA